ncbi:MBL fold metallo-hydrolase [Algiphilus sp.]|uniref:MBL fold metallo-hydrolase n=1 Tax=Algiphilus sp. TaxID=1872431 RepID=UPI0025C11BCE|nr:MBL fold metallo-hydrolase [Algiphilus sp.]MCK5770646.1 MBL fold metallo-hydrolase [Algiphilus sp.]
MRFTLVLLAVLMAGCVESRWDGEPSDHFDGRHFHNEEPFEEGLADLVRFFLSREPGTWQRELEPIDTPPPPRRVDSGTLRMTVIGHATVLVQADGVNLLTDPIWSDRASPLSWAGPHRYRPPGLAFEDLPPIDVVVISHNHYDHLDLPTLRRLDAEHDPTFIVPAGDQVILRENGITPVVPRDWGQGWEMPNGCRLTAVQVRHWSGRRILPSDRNLSLWTGYVMDTDGGPLYFAGDTGYESHFTETRRAHGPLRAALLPIGAYRPRWLTEYQHLSPGDAVQAHLDLQSPFSVGIHHGTFKLANDDMNEAADTLDERTAERGLAPDVFPPGREGTTYPVPPLPEATPCSSQGIS